MVVPGFFDGFGALGADAWDFAEACGFFGDDAEGIGFKVIDDFVSVNFTDAGDEAAA